MEASTHFGGNLVNQDLRRNGNRVGPLRSNVIQRRGIYLVLMRRLRQLARALMLSREHGYDAEGVARASPAPE